MIFLFEFQFLMVRLKVCAVGFQETSKLYFNSYLVRLFMIQRYITFLEIPNFLDTILYVFLLIFINFVYKQLIVNMLVYVIFFAFYITVFTVFLNSFFKFSKMSKYSFFIVVKLVKFLFLYVSKMSHML